SVDAGRVTVDSCLRGLGLLVLAAPLVTHVDDGWFTIARAAAIQLEHGSRGDQLAELRVAVAAGGEFRALVGDDVTNGCEHGPAVIVGGRFYGVAQQAHQRGIPLELHGRGGRFGCGRRAGRRGEVRGIAEILDVDKLVAGRDERLGRLVLAESVDGEA